MTRSVEWLELRRIAKARGWRVVYRDARLAFVRSDWRYIAISDDYAQLAMIPREPGQHDYTAPSE